ncbi:hypothetical protein PLANTIT3_60196 [Plantibacter sp. T3]|nr:hypothetical protein PLANTIT3_60196 [Plantibacter sp. T3]
MRVHLFRSLSLSKCLRVPFDRLRDRMGVAGLGCFSVRPSTGSVSGGGSGIGRARLVCPGGLVVQAAIRVLGLRRITLIQGEEVLGRAGQGSAGVDAQARETVVAPHVGGDPGRLACAVAGMEDEVSIGPLVVHHPGPGEVDRVVRAGVVAKTALDIRGPGGGLEGPVVGELEPGVPSAPGADGLTTWQSVPRVRAGDERRAEQDCEYGGGHPA